MNVIVRPYFDAFYQIGNNHLLGREVCGVIADLSLGNAILKDVAEGNKLVSPAKRKKTAKAVQEKYCLSERKVCGALSVSRNCLRYERKRLPDEEELTVRITELACRYGRYGYRRITALLRAEGWTANQKRVERESGGSKG